MRVRARAIQAMLLCLGLLAACGRGAEPVPELPPLPMDARILAFGDSLTWGTGTTPGNSYPGQLAERTGLEIINAGVPGETTAQGLERLPGVLDEYRPDLVLLCLGGNDMLRRMSRSALAYNLDAMVRLIHEREIPVVLISVPELSGLSLRSEPLYRELAGRHGLPLEDAIMAEVLGSRSLRSDQIHPNARGYARIADALHELLRRTGAL
jgi:acyl-CoA thioesterase-1